MRKIDIPEWVNRDTLVLELFDAFGSDFSWQGDTVLIDDSPEAVELFQAVLDRHNPKKRSELQKRQDRIDRNVRSAEKVLGGAVVDVVGLADFGKWTPEQKDALLYLLWQRAED